MFFAAEGLIKKIHIQSAQSHSYAILDLIISYDHTNRKKCLITRNLCVNLNATLNATKSSV